MEGNVSLSPINRQFIASQGIIKEVGSRLAKRKKTNKEKEMKQQPKPKPMAKPQPKPSGYRPTKADSAFSKRSGIAMSEIIGQGGVTPQSVTNEIKKTGGYMVRMKPTGLYKTKSKKK